MKWVRVKERLARNVRMSYARRGNLEPKKGVSGGNGKSVVRNFRFLAISSTHECSFNLTETILRFKVFQNLFFRTWTPRRTSERIWRTWKWWRPFSSACRFSDSCTRKFPAFRPPFWKIFNIFKLVLKEFQAIQLFWESKRLSFLKYVSGKLEIE